MTELKLHHASENIVMFWCPGCDNAHGVRVAGHGSFWTWNGSDTAPTFSPSVLAIGAQRCHSFVENGKIRFLTDSMHHLAGQTVDLPPWSGFSGNV